jgi:hypothetical protein
MAKKIAKKKNTKVAKKVAKKKITKKNVKKSPEKAFDSWWLKTATKKVDKIENQWVKQNEPNGPDDEEGGDHWCVNQMMHDGDASGMTYDIAKEVFIKGFNNESWDMSQSESLYCELDDVIAEAYPAGKASRGKA